MSGSALLPVGSGQPHDNRQPYLGVTFIIALQGIFPSQN
jgi:microcystin-dependent protein